MLCAIASAKSLFVTTCVVVSFRTEPSISCKLCIEGIEGNSTVSRLAIEGVLFDSKEGGVLADMESCGI